ncbi:GNAT family N-acetyltransferase [Sulfitobacter sp. G21635-S1]|uniref:GNAT family N-acetyltransferase n=1 Tax=Sulfitobacter sp. G21635-S1 TaxID=3014043 RepID=UPI0022AEC5E3|nr:GNAT family N-acetyltransferase [Sulfitobacter sp. G21635-S1]MCZ4255070.1 GNAT family N-acetyltransferase [Sulfitobacter sp. G21635-S1]
MKHDIVTAGTAQGADLRVEVVDTQPGFAALKEAWQALEQRDPEGTVFLSWDWLREAFADQLYRWSVLVVRDGGGAVVCLVPLKYRVHWSGSRQEFQTQLQAGGRLLWSEYTGFLCAPECAQAGLEAAARHLAAMPWISLSMRYVAQQERCRIFTDALEAAGIAVRYLPYMINRGETDNLKCPQVALPADFDTYLGTRVSRNKRQQYNRFRRKHLETETYRITHATEETLEADLDCLMGFWADTWGEKKGRQTAGIVAQYRRMLTAAARTGNLFLPLLWQGDRPLGGLGHVVDPRRGMVHFILVGRDQSAEEPFVGAALHYHSIAWAIEQGFGCYDFSHGNEAYKYSYGAEDIEVLFFEARRREPGDDNVFDSLCLGAALTRLQGFIEEGDTGRAARACAQLARIMS